MSYGTGAIMGVPAHDQRDFEFARKFGMPIARSFAAEGESAERSRDLDAAQDGHGRRWSTPAPSTARRRDEAIASGHRRAWRNTASASACVNYRLRDWLI